MIISFSGAQSTGKTTLLKNCKRNDLFWKCEFIPEVTRLVKRKFGVSINEEGNNITQLCIINQHLENYLTCKQGHVIMDRCILDGVVYTEYLFNNKKVDEWVLDYARKMFGELMPKIDTIYYTCPDIPLVDDGERSINKEFRDDIIKLFDKYKPLCENIVELKGSVEERMEILKDSIINPGIKKNIAYNY